MDWEGHRGTFRSDGHILYVDLSTGYMGAYMCKKLLSRTLKDLYVLLGVY